eukprot:FR741948.1.p1 GENE.FR741948.1~~FR741948.1.p1  ORF type:complete len:358 (+),score=66.77 FR741948.1:28-1101(+)
MMRHHGLWLWLLPTLAMSFTTPRMFNRGGELQQATCGGANVHNPPRSTPRHPRVYFSTPRDAIEEESVEIQLKAEIDDTKVLKLFAWVSRAFEGDPLYNDLVIALYAIFGDKSEANPQLKKMVENAMVSLQSENTPVGNPLSLRDRESASMGAMGAGQWLGQYKTRPHALLSVVDFESVDEWSKGLSRGCRRTLVRASKQNYTTTTVVIKGDAPAPHSTLAHFRCVVAHELRLLATEPDAFFDALTAAINRYLGSTQQARSIQEYRDPKRESPCLRPPKFGKGKVMRGAVVLPHRKAAPETVCLGSLSVPGTWGRQAPPKTKGALNFLGTPGPLAGLSNAFYWSLKKKKYRAFPNSC